MKTSTELPRNSSATLENYLENFGEYLETLVWLSGNFWRILGNLRTVVGNLRTNKIVKNVVSTCVCL